MTTTEHAPAIDIAGAETDINGLTLEEYQRHCRDYAAWLDESALDLPDYE